MDVDALTAAAIAAGLAERRVHRRHSTVIFRVEIGATIDQQLNSSIPAPKSSAVERSLSTNVVLPIDFAASIEEKLQRLDGALRRVICREDAACVSVDGTQSSCGHDRRGSTNVRKVPIGAVLE